MRAILYTRVSSKEQLKNFSLPTQKKACVEYCVRNGFEIDRIFVDEGESAKTTNRPEFLKLLSYCRENAGKIQFLVVYSVNRFARDKHDHFVIRALLKTYGISLRSVTEPIDDSPEGKFIEGILSSHAQFDNDVRSVRTSVGMKSALESGKWPHQAPLGYLNNNKKRPSLIPDPRSAELVKKAFELYSSGLYTIRQVLEIVIKLGLRTKKGGAVSIQTFGYMIKNPLYTGFGRSTLTEEPEKGDFEPLVNSDTFNRCQAILSGKKPAITPYHRNNPHFPLRRFVKCGYCGKPLTGSKSKGRSKYYAFYSCYNRSCRKTNVRKEVFEKLFIEFLERMKPNPSHLKLLNAVLLDRFREKRAESSLLREKLEKKILELRDKKHKLLETFVYRQEIDSKSYQSELNKLNEESYLSEIDLKDARLEEMDMEGMLNFASYAVSNAARIWVECTLDQKQRFQKSLFPDGIEFLEGKFGTAATSILFSMLEPQRPQKEKMATPTGFEPVSSP